MPNPRAAAALPAAETPAPAELADQAEDSPAAALPQANEAGRLDALRGYRILDTDPEEAFDELTRLAAYICGTPISLVSLTDRERQWFKARVGFAPAEAPREVAFCQYAMRAPDLYEIPDTAEHPLFRDNPLVTDGPRFRFYVGAPLVSPEGFPLGTLCALDTRPHQLNDGQREALRVLARQVMAHLELRRTRLLLEDERRTLDGVLRLANSKAESLYAGPAGDQPAADIFVKQEQRLVRVPTADLYYAEALGDYVNLYTARERFTVYSALKDMEAKLPVRDFLRVHRKYIVRLDRISAIEADTVLLDAPAEGRLNAVLPIGNSYRASLLSRLNSV